MSAASARNRQYAALPYRRRADGNIEVMLITSLNTRRWIIPKGWPAPGLTPHESAAREAMEEGGLIGRIDDHAIGHYFYEKRLADGSTLHCQVEIFALEVTEQLTYWPEKGQRQTQWFAVAAAAKAVREPDLGAMISGLLKHLA